jgi:hypothetical protein
MPTVFVSAFLNLYEDRSKDKSADTCFAHFASLADTGIDLHIFLSPCYEELYQRLIGPRPNVQVEYLEYTDLDTYKELQDVSYTLPKVRTDYHDTAKFMILMNSKVELVSRVAKKHRATGGPVTHYAWIDFSIFHIFHGADTPAYIKMLGSSALKDGLYIPGCWGPGLPSFAAVCWRFCGGLFIGDAASIDSFYQAYRTYFKEIVITEGLAWEVNVWAWLEYHKKITVNWIWGYHNDTIVRAPTAIRVVASLTTIPPRADALRLTLDSLMPQVDHTYVSICPKYKRFGAWTTPPYLEEEPYRSKVTFVITEDKGPATKYVGALDHIPKDTWVFVCDDDQEYHPGLIARMRASITCLGVFQNHYHGIQKKTSGGLIHGYVGLLVHASLLQGLREFPLPAAAQFVDDQWMSIYCHLNNIPIMNTGAECYKDIYSVLHGAHEKIGAASLAALQNRDEMVAALACSFGVSFNSSARWKVETAPRL